jgi:hypothetical protein
VAAPGSLTANETEHARLHEAKPGRFHETASMVLQWSLRGFLHSRVRRPCHVKNGMWRKGTHLTSRNLGDAFYQDSVRFGRRSPCKLSSFGVAVHKSKGVRGQTEI